MKVRKSFLIPMVLMGMLLSGCPSPQETDNTVKVNGVELSADTVTLDINDTSELTANVLPTDATNKEVTWSVSNENVISFANNVITGLSSGTSIITVTTVDGGFTDTCTVTVNEAPVAMTIALDNRVSSYVTATLSKTTAFADDEVTINLSNFSSVYDLSDFTLKTSNGGDVQIKSQNDTSITFFMPRTPDIYLDAKVTGKDIKVFLTDAQGLISGKPAFKPIGATDFIETTPVKDGNDTYITVQYGSEVKFTFADKQYIKATGITVDGIPVARAANSDSVSFQAVLDDISDFWFEVKVTFVDETPITGDYRFEVNKTVHITDVKLLGSDKTTPVNGANQGNKVYLQITTAEGYSVRKVTIKYTTDDMGHYSTVSATEEDGYYVFTVPYGKSDVMTIIVEEADDNALKGCDGVGTYIGVVFGPGSSNGRYTEFAKTTNTTIGLSGDCLFGTYQTVITSYDENELVTDMYAGEHLPCNNNLLLWCADSTYVKAPYGSYNYLCVKKQADTDLDSQYTVYGERIIWNDHKVDVVEFYRDGVSYARALLDETAKQTYFGVTFNFLSGSNISDAKVCYEVLSSKGTKLLTIGSEDTGGYSKRSLLGDHYGTYASNDLSLSIFSASKATYKNEEFMYEVDATDANKLTLKTSTKTVVVTVDDTARTFVVVSEEENALDLPAFAGKKYRATTGLEDDLLYYNFYIEFSDSDMLMSCVGGCDQYLDLDHCTTQKFAYNKDVAYTFDKTTNVVTASIVIKGGSTKTVKFTYKPSKNQFTCSATDLGRDFYSGTVTLSEVQ